MKRLAGMLLVVIRAGRGRACRCFRWRWLPACSHGIEESPLPPYARRSSTTISAGSRDHGTTEPVIIVGIDSQSLARTRAMAPAARPDCRLVDRIQAGKPLAVGVDIVFAEPDRSAPRCCRAFPGLTSETPAALPDPDGELAQALERAPSVLPWSA